MVREAMGATHSAGVYVLRATGDLVKLIFWDGTGHGCWWPSGWRTEVP